MSIKGKLNKIKKIVIGGMIIISLMAAIACGSVSEDYTPSTAQSTSQVSTDTDKSKLAASLKGNKSIESFFDMDNENRRTLDKLNNEWVLPREYTLKNIDHNGLKMNMIYKENSSTDKVILQLHGGAYRKSLADYPTMFQRTAVKYADMSGGKVLTIDYRVAPPHPFPAALEDAVSAYKWLLDNGYKAKNIIIAGDSAGGGLTLATA